MHMIKPPVQRHSHRRHRLLRSLGHQFSFGFFALCEKQRECKCDMATVMTTNLYNVARHSPHPIIFVCGSWSSLIESLIESAKEEEESMRRRS
ncbi:hypothetical protein ISN45_At02g024930 [Arabidopsis thaliana x Arabidopsis arenosa]|uniref:Uncharacterized protein n=2 Tax=Arabidopsis TaxID=3701 RepID=A0A8T2G1V3_ARASU|nr:hypothetical protein ISN45_At02g024930 [Arabidopsis thaliana x Arabidopsis arenosa]KAG7642632.1 hypothetical protein ISN44_As02g025260 [Arabidopsis suecica]